MAFEKHYLNKDISATSVSKKNRKKGFPKTEITPIVSNPVRNFTIMNNNNTGIIKGINLSIIVSLGPFCTNRSMNARESRFASVIKRPPEGTRLEIFAQE